MWLPANPDKIPRLFLPCPSNDENQLEPGMLGLKDTGNGTELWCRAPRVNSGDPEPTPFLVAVDADIPRSLAELNTLIGETLDTTSDTRTPTAHSLGGSAHSADTLANFNTKLSDADLPHNISGAQAIGEALEITNGAYGTDSFKVENRDLTLLKTGDTVSSDVVSLSTFAACDRGFYTNLNTSNTIYRFDRSTGQLLSQTTGTYNNRAIACVPAGVVHIENNTYKLLSDDLGTLLDTGSMTGDTLANVALACKYSKHDGLIHIVTYDEIYYQIDPTTWASTSIRSLAEMAANAYSLDADATYLYTGESATGSAIYIRKFNVSDGVSQATSASFGTATADTSIAIDASDSSLLVVVIGKTVYHLAKSDLSTVWTGAASADVFGGAIIDGILYGMLENGSDVDFKAYQLPALTIKAPAFTVNKEGIMSTPSVIDTAGNEIQVTNSQIIRSVVDIQPLIKNQFGAIVESVETSEPGSPVVGKYYLMDSTSTWYPNTVAYYDVRGWHIYQLYDGLVVRCVDDESYYKVVDDVVYGGFTHDVAAGGLQRIAKNAISENTLGVSEYVLVAQTETSTATTDSANLYIDPDDTSVLIDMEAYSLLKIDIELAAGCTTSPGGGDAEFWSGYVTARPSGGSGALIIKADTVTSLASGFNNNPELTLNNPSISIVSDALQVSVSHTSTSTNNYVVDWQAKITVNKLASLALTC